MQLAFRTPTKCQNGHFRWYHYSVEFGTVKAFWGPRLLECKCSTHEFREGFEKCGDDQQCIGLRDYDGGIDIYEGDILGVTNSNLGGYGNTFVVVRSTEEAGFLEGFDGGVISGASIEDGMMTVVGNVYEPEV